MLDKLTVAIKHELDQLQRTRPSETGETEKKDGTGIDPKNPRIALESKKEVTGPKSDSGMDPKYPSGYCRLSETLSNHHI